MQFVLPSFHVRSLLEESAKHCGSWGSLAQKPHCTGRQLFPRISSSNPQRVLVWLHRRSHGLQTLRCVAEHHYLHLGEKRRLRALAGDTGKRRLRGRPLAGRAPGSGGPIWGPPLPAAQRWAEPGWPRVGEKQPAWKRGGKLRRNRCRGGGDDSGRKAADPGKAAGPGAEEGAPLGPAFRGAHRRGSQPPSFRAPPLFFGACWTVQPHGCRCLEKTALRSTRIYCDSRRALRGPFRRRAAPGLYTIPRS